MLDGGGEPVPDAMVEIWPEWGRCGTDAEGRYSFVTRKPWRRAGRRRTSPCSSSLAAS